MTREAADRSPTSPSPSGSAADSVGQPVHGEPTRTVGSTAEPVPLHLEETSPYLTGDALGRSSEPQRTQISEYELLGEIARGGMGIVYRARDRKLNRLVALKVTRGQLASGDEAKRFQAEAEAAAKLDHPHIVPIYEVGESDGLSFFSMAFVEGQSLAQRVAAGPLPPRDAAALIRQVAEAVAYAHSRGVIHRDLKPGNIMLDAAGQPRVTDFGLAKRTDSDSSLTQAGQVMGTPSFMPPEQAQGKNEQVGPLADVYSLGATLYCLVTGRPPFHSANVVETLKQVVEREPAAPHLLNPAVDRDLDTICLKCLQKRPEKRYASATALAEDLHRYLDHRSILARPVGDVEKLTRWCRRNPLEAATLTGIVAISVLAFVLISWNYLRAEDARKEEATQRQEAQTREKAERWERYRANMVAAGGAMQLHNISAARDALEAAPDEHRNWEWHYFSHQLDTAQHVIRLGDRIQVIAISPDGTLAAVQPAVGPAQLWDLRTRQQTGSLPNLSPVSEFIFSPDGKLLACEFADRMAIWDVDAARERAVLKLPARRIHELAEFSSDGSRLAICCEDKTVRVWDTASGKELLALRGFEQEVAQAVFSPDAKRILTAGGNSRNARIWNAETGDLLRVLPGEGSVGHAIFNPRGDRIVTVESYPSNLLRLWDAETGKMLEEMRGHTNAAEAIAHSPDGLRIVSGGIDRSIRLWDGRSGKAVSSRDGHRDRVQHVGFSPDGKTTITAAMDRTVRLWDSMNGAPLAVLHGHTGAISAASYSADGRTIVTASVAEGAIRLWDARSAERNAALRGHTSFVYDVAFHPDGERVVSAAWDGTIRIWNATTGRELSTLRYAATPPSSDAIINSVAINSDGTLIATSGRDGVVRLWDPATEKEIHRFGDAGGDPALDPGSPRVRFSPRGDRLASGRTDGTVRVWDVSQRTEVAVLHGHSRSVHEVAFSPDGTWLASGGLDRTVRIWDIANQRQLHLLEGHTSDVFAVAVSRDGKWLASSSADGTARIWDTSTWKLVEELKHGTNVFGVAFTPDGTRLACACANNLIRLWDMKTFKLVAELDGHADYVHQIAFSPDGTRLVSGSGDKTVRVWDTLSAQSRREGMKATGGK